MDDKELYKWLGNNPQHFKWIIIAFCICCFSISSCTILVTKYEYAYRTERDKVLWSKNHKE